jgi:hypothetical protein
VEISRFTQLSDFINRGEIITTDGYLRHCQSSDRVTYVKRDFLFSGGMWRGVEQKSFLISRLHGSPQRTIVVGHSDIPTKAKHQILLAAIGINQIFGINLRPIKNLSSALPLGLTNYCDDSGLHRIIGDLENLRVADQCSDFCEAFSPNYFASFNVATNNKARSQVVKVLNSLSSPSKVVFSDVSYDKNSLISYLKNLRSFPFVICPEGNGFDTHRLWETLYMGGIPVIKKNDYLSEITRNLPVVILNEWDELNNVDLMHINWLRIQNSIWDFNNLKLSFWNNLISSS